MYTAIAGTLFALLLTLFNVRVSAAEIWVCTQPNGSTLYTDEPQGQRSCDKFEPGSQLILLPPRIWPSVPPGDATYEEQETQATEEQSESRIEEQAAVSSDTAESYKAHPDTFWGWDENPVFFYTYVSPFYGIPPSRHMRPPELGSHPQTQYGTRHNIPMASINSFTATKHGRENPVRPSVQTARHQSVSPASSTHVRDSSAGAAAPAL